MVLTRRLTRKLWTLLLLLVAGFALVTSPVLAHRGEKHGAKATQHMAKARQAPAASAGQANGAAPLSEAGPAGKSLDEAMRANAAEPAPKQTHATRQAAPAEAGRSMKQWRLRGPIAAVWLARRRFQSRRLMLSARPAAARPTAVVERS